MMHYVAFFITTAVLVMFLGSKQRRMYDRYAITTYVLIIALACTSVVLLHGTSLFPAAALALALLLLVHRSITQFAADATPLLLHSDDSQCALFHPRDACTHETWVIAALTAAIVSALRL